MAGSTSSICTRPQQSAQEGPLSGTSEHASVQAGALGARGPRPPYDVRKQSPGPHGVPVGTHHRRTSEQVWQEKVVGQWLRTPAASRKREALSTHHGFRSV